MKNRLGSLNKNHALSLRHDLTTAENILWSVLRNRKLKGLKFRRQEPIGIYIADFVCLEKNLIIELDGSGHNQDEQIEYDRERTIYLQSLGFRVVRFWNDDVINNLEGVLTYLGNYLS
jgi:very-short-patch-repair endonuclease